jgi:hypothetical protein
VRVSSQYGTCRSCSAPIYWVKTRAGKNMPVDADTATRGDTQFDPQAGHISHYATCPQAKDHRKRDGGGSWSPAAVAPARFMTDERMAEVGKRLDAARIPGATFRSIRNCEGITAPPEKWDEATYHAVLALIDKVAADRRAIANRIATKQGDQTA